MSGGMRRVVRNLAALLYIYFVMTMTKLKSWHTREERKLIKKFGGKPLVKFGTDGRIGNRPVEVRSARKDNRFRIQKDVHKKLVRKNGSYIFKAKGKRPKKVSAKRVSKLIGSGKWYKDRKYPHKFVKIKQIW